MSATAWVSAAEPDRQQYTLSCTYVNLSVTRFACQTKHYQRHARISVRHTHNVAPGRRATVRANDDSSIELDSHN